MGEGSDSPPQPPPSPFIDKINQAIIRNATPENIDMLRSSCIFNIVSHSAMGFVFGGLLGAFLSGMASTGPEAHLLNPSAAPAPGLRAQVTGALREMGSRTWRSAKNFAYIAALFTGFECAVETYRARHDLLNTAVAGCATGAVLGARSGPKAAAMGCVGFAAFSTAIEHFLQDRPSVDD